MTNFALFFDLWRNGDLIAKGVTCLLLIMSIASWTIIITKILHNRRPINAVVARGASKISRVAMPEVLDPIRIARVIGETSDPVRQQQLLVSELSAIAIRLQIGMTTLSSIAATSPFIGLFGTVLGIYHALIAIAQQGQNTIATVAGPVGESLVMTALGLLVAVPAVLGYNALVRSNKLLMFQIKAQAIKELGRNS